MNDLFPLPHLHDRIDGLAKRMTGQPVIGLSVQAGGGKSTVAGILERDHGYTAIEFATPLKRAAQAMFGLTDAQAFGDSLKHRVVAHVGLTPREIFQRLGDEVARTHIDTDIWLHRAIREMHDVLDEAGEAAPIVITDVRYTNEADLVRALGGHLWHIQGPTRRGNEYDDRPTDTTHPSEAGLPIAADDRVLINEDTLDVLRRQVGQTLETGRALSDDDGMSP
jgi:hypothetical protein